MFAQDADTLQLLLKAGADPLLHTGVSVPVVHCIFA